MKTDLRSNSKRRGAFTLIELLVVIAIIVILAAILFPVFQRAREKARQTSCASNEQQLGLAFMQYDQDYDECMPCGINNGSNNGVGWAGQIYTYVKSTDVFNCPDNPKVQTAAASYPLAYVYNFNVGDYFTGKPAPGAPLSKFNAPSKTVLMCEVFGSVVKITTPNENSSAIACGADSVGLSPSTPAYETGYMGNRLPDPTTGKIGYDGAPQWVHSTGIHSGGSNFVFSDGHVKWLQGSEVSSGVDAKSTTAAETGPCVAATSGETCNAAGTADPSNQYAVTFSVL